MHPVYNELHRILREQWLNNSSIQQHVYTSRPNVSKELFDRVGVCYCPPDTVEIVDELRKHFTLQELVDYSLIKIDDKPTVEYIPPSQRKYELTLKNRWVLPICDSDGHIQSFVGRTLTDAVKWLSLSNSDVSGFKRGDWMYPLNIFENNGSCVLVEGYTDALIGYEYGCPNFLSIFGIQITSAQVEWLIQNKIKHVSIALDGDISGLIASMKTILAIKYRNDDIHTYVIDTLDSDPDELSRDVFWQQYFKKVEISTKHTDNYPFQFMNDIIANIDMNDEKTANVMKGGGWNVISSFCRYFANIHYDDNRMLIKEKFGIDIAREKAQNLNSWYRK